MAAFLKTLLSFTRPYRGRLILGLFFGLFVALASAALMIWVKEVMDVVFAAGEETSALAKASAMPEFLRGAAGWAVSLLKSAPSPSSDAGKVLMILVIPVLMFFQVVSAYLNFYLLQWVAIRSVCDIRVRLFDKLQRLSVGFYHSTNTGELISRISNDTYSLTKAITGILPVIVVGPATVIALVAVLLAKQPKLTLISLIVLPLCIAPVAIYGRKVRKSTKKLQENFAELTELMQETFSGHRMVKAYNLEETMLARFKASTGRFISHYMRIVRSLEVPGSLVEVMGAIGVALVLIYVALVDKKTPGDFLQFVLAIVSLYKPIKELSRLPGQLEQARASSERVFELMALGEDLPEPTSPKELKAAGAVIRFEKLSFSYPSKPALIDFDLTIRPGQKIALVGKSGSGKTTVSSLLLRFYDPQQGAITIGGVDLRDVSTKSLREQIAVVSQDIVLFNDTVTGNIALGRPGATREEIEAAAKAAFAHEFILEKPQGYDTPVGERGSQLSGGQRQRIAIARAILRNAPILILDEATSALDTESERAVQAALEVLMRGRTTLCIAHRLSTIVNADLIVVMDEGRIVESGKHSELLALNGAYGRLHDLQFNA